MIPPSSESVSSIELTCSNCLKLATRLGQIERDREALKHALAVERERYNALYIADLPQRKAPSVSGDLPLRYRLVDRAYGAVKRHVPARGLAAVRGRLARFRAGK